MTKYDFSCQTIMQILARHKPAGMNKHFSMAVVVESLANTLDEDKQVEQTSCQFSRTVLKSSWVCCEEAASTPTSHDVFSHVFLILHKCGDIGNWRRYLGKAAHHV